MTTYCPFCKKAIKFAKDIKYETVPCPECEHPIILIPFTSWKQLKTETKLVFAYWNEFLSVHILWLVGIAISSLILAGLSFCTKETLGMLLILILILLPSSGIFYCFCKLPPPLPPKPVKPSQLPPKPVKPSPTSFFDPFCSNQTANGNNNFHTTYNFTIHGNVKIIKCNYCGALRPETVLTCLSCGAA